MQVGRKVVAVYGGKITHGLRKTKAYQVWYDMMYRCYNQKALNYPYYGGRGIKVSKRWHDVRNFVNDMGQPSKRLTIERKDNSGNYERNNCKWATRKEQQANRRAYGSALSPPVRF